MPLVFIYLFVLSSCMSLVFRRGKKAPDQEGAVGYPAFLFPESHVENMNYKGDKE